MNLSGPKAIVPSRGLAQGSGARPQGGPMAAIVIDGKKVSEDIRAEIRGRCARLPLSIVPAPPPMQGGRRAVRASRFPGAVGGG